MEEINENVKSIEDKLKKLNSFIALSLKRNEMVDDLKRIQIQANKVGALVNHAHQLMQSNLEDVQKDYEYTMARTRNLQSILMDYLINEKLEKMKLSKHNEKSILDHKSKPINEQSHGKQHLTPNINTGANCSMLHPILKQHSNNLATPIMKIVEYKESPLIKRKINPLPIIFSDFLTKITQEQFEQIPKYMCGRETLNQLNTFLETVIIPCFNEKYQLMYKPRSSVRKPEDLELWKIYHSQALFLPKEHFITSNDITRKLDKLIDKKIQNRLVILRHLRIIHETRIHQTVCFIWTA